ncbi:unnamed protein product [Prunus armeniaca]|uniref:Uncharacterized protein n=2 Tax=Prunus armeniaca TaxID=36596 RepID=A0A6J5VTV5_PRUAR|nr:unnamed protein product [Prunus armeniaca]
MAVRANIEGAEKGLMKIKLKNPDGKNKKEAEKMVKLKLNTTEKVEIKKIMVLEEPHQLSWFKPKAASVFPAKRKSVKRMIFDRLVVYFGSVVSHSAPSSSSAVGVASQTPQA